MLRERLCLITDRRAAGHRLVAVVDAALAALPAGAALVQLREKDLGARDLLALAADLIVVCRARGARLVVNDRADVALAAGADGVHLPERGMPVADARTLVGLVGESTHTPAAARASQADYAFLGPVFDTPAKRAYGPPLGPAAISAALGGSARLFAVGGIDGPDAARHAIAAGAHGIAVIRAIMAAPDPTLAAATLWRALG